VTALRLGALDHVGIVVDDIGEAERLLAALGLRAAGGSEPPGLRTAFFELSGAHIELIEFFEDGARAERLGEAQARIDHIAFAVPDLDEAVEALAALGIETTSAQVSGGRRMCWTVASTSDGVLYQLIEEIADHATSPVQMPQSAP
jgi:catechol 2,3-dioxygenase-like lactoylglutathione lyase family enzyme